ncbi:helix-turn-helix domain-containing protein [Candidatus Uhrbacteria bacterium]|nr:helix-turn-helix domain-containing protein [Candidatus Uhrbacteria bacterium]
MSNVEEQLNALGLTSTEAKIYLAGLGRSGIGVQELSKETQVKRPTVYHALETLIQKGLVSKKGTGARRIFHMSSPENIGHLLDSQIAGLEEQKKGLEILIPLLIARIDETSSETIEVSQYEGIEGIKMVVEEALYCKKRHWDIIAPKRNFFSEFDKNYAQYYLSSRRRRGITSRSLWEKTLEDAKHTPGGHKVTPETVKERNPRYLPSVMSGKFASVMILFDDKVALISSYKTLTAVLIRSTEIHEFMKTMFEGLWQGSEEL